MPSGNAIYTYTGKEPSVTIQGHEFVKDKPILVRDNGVIAVLEGRKDFEIQHKPELITGSTIPAGGEVMRDTEQPRKLVSESRDNPSAKPKGKAK